MGHKSDQIFLENSDQTGPPVYIIVLNWNGWRDTVACVESLQELSYPNYTIVLVDNGSQDDSVTKLEAYFPKLALIKLDENRGYAGGNNAGIRYALQQKAAYIWILNNDTVVDAQALSPLVSRMKDHPQMGLCGSMIYYFGDPPQLQAAGGGTFNPWLGITKLCKPTHRPLKTQVTDIESSLDFIAGAAVFVSRSFIEQVGLMDESYFLYYEEIDWAERGKNLFRLGLAVRSNVYHKEGASINKEKEQKDKRSRLADFYQIRNRLKFAQKFYPACLPTVFCTVLVAFAKRLFTGQWDRAWMIAKLMISFNEATYPHE